MFTTFRGGPSGAWRVTGFSAVKGAPLQAVPSLSVVHSEAIALPLLPSPTAWRLAGVASYVRYVERGEKTQLTAAQEGLGRPEASCAALIPIKKSAAWWELTQEERRRIFEDQSHHIATGLKYLPMVARQLYHCRDLGEPFDFLTWFEYAPQNALFFEDLVRALRATEEWSYVEREVDIRVTRIDLAG
ncbi:chlorite dismutase family protein [Bradyrhizobium sp.]|uniref:chlorite dismutase family protein n=1 Tax=Bradyrhizobium sp. TaxID=376 RepID=UPI00272F3651|nr:chlorite dismutase family protein [Bradyrhizobium sp.]MDP1869133.1 chlorite dismutase family protein [Bradyrhizobium sp.]MDP3078107.1 chlorite dismutase family protein [Bradyrhizobium sp.]